MPVITGFAAVPRGLICLVRMFDSFWKDSSSLAGFDCVRVVACGQWLTKALSTD